MVSFLLSHKTALLEMIPVAGWLFSAACSSMPALPDKAGYLLTWAHNFLQAVAGNINKIRG